MPTVYDKADDFRRHAIQRETSAAKSIVAAYATAWRDIEKKLNDLFAMAGDRPTEAQLVRMAQYADTLRSLNENLSTINDKTARITQGQQAWAVESAQKTLAAQLEAYAKAHGRTFKRPVTAVPNDAIKELVGYLGDGTPLDVWLKARSTATVADAKQALIRGFVSGQNPNKIAKTVKDIWGHSASRALSMARTETFRAYRTGSIAAYEKNGDVIKGYQWLATKSDRTCAACLASDGEVFKLNEQPQMHVNCRCTIVPVFTGDKPKKDTGAAWFEQQSEATKQKILGPNGYEAYKAGANLNDFNHTIDDPVWGKQRVSRIPN